MREGLIERIWGAGERLRSDQPMIMGNLHEQDFDTIWNRPQAKKVLQMVKNCDKQCWMIGSAAPAMKKRISVPLKWVVKNKLKVWKKGGKDICLSPIGEGSIYIFKWDVLVDSCIIIHERPQSAARKYHCTANAM